MVVNLWVLISRFQVQGDFPYLQVSCVLLFLFYIPCNSFPPARKACRGTGVRDLDGECVSTWDFDPGLSLRLERSIEEGVVVAAGVE